MAPGVTAEFVVSPITATTSELGLVVTRLTVAVVDEPDAEAMAPIGRVVVPSRVFMNPATTALACGKVAPEKFTVNDAAASAEAQAPQMATFPCVEPLFTSDLTAVKVSDPPVIEVITAASCDSSEKTSTSVLRWLEAYAPVV